MANSVRFITYLLSRGGSSSGKTTRRQVSSRERERERERASEKLGENFLFETTLGNYSETNEKQILSRNAIYLTD